MSLKQAYRSRGAWPVAARRELALLNILNILLPPGYVAVATGLGTGTTDLVDAGYTSPIDAFDIVVYRQTRDGLEPAAFLDVTGFREEKAARKINGRTLLCVGSWKLHKAREYGLLDKAWAVHVADKRVSLRWIKLSRLTLGDRVRLVDGENIYYCLPQEKWTDTSTFLQQLKGE